MQLEAVASHATVHFMQALLERDEGLTGDKAKARAFTTSPRGTIAYLSRLADLVIICRRCRGYMKYKTVDSDRIKVARDIVGEFRVVTQQLEALWSSRSSWLATAGVKRKSQLFLAPQTLHALDNSVEGFTGKW